MKNISNQVRRDAMPAALTKQARRSRAASSQVPGNGEVAGLTAHQRAVARLVHETVRNLPEDLRAREQLLSAILELLGDDHPARKAAEQMMDRIQEAIRLHELIAQLQAELSLKFADPL